MNRNMISISFRDLKWYSSSFGCWDVVYVVYTRRHSVYRDNPCDIQSPHIQSPKDSTAFVQTITTSTNSFPHTHWSAFRCGRRRYWTFPSHWLSDTERSSSGTWFRSYIWCQRIPCCSPLPILAIQRQIGFVIRFDRNRNHQHLRQLLLDDCLLLRRSRITIPILSRYFLTAWPVVSTSRPRRRTMITLPSVFLFSFGCTLWSRSIVGWPESGFHSTLPPFSGRERML